MTGKTQEQRIEDAARALFMVAVVDDRVWDRIDRSQQDFWRDRARRALEAADAPPKPQWPTEASTDAWNARTARHDYLPFVWTEECLDCLRAAMLADPIIQAAIAYRDKFQDLSTTYPGRNVIDAVNEAGL